MSQSETEAVNADSFLDIVASIVSIMIIMILMTGLKIRHTPLDVLMADEAAAAKVETASTADEENVRRDVMRTAEEIRHIQAQTMAVAQRRDALVLAVTSLEQRLDGIQQDAGHQSQQDQALAERLAGARRRLEELQQQQAAVASAPRPATRIECYHTPLSKTVDGREVHFQLRRRRIAYIPWDSLAAAFKSDAERKVYKLRDSPTLTDTVGPEGGFRLRYTLQRHEITAEEYGREGRSGVSIRFHYFLIPTDPDLGETIAEALAPRSEFHTALADRRARDATVTVWVYPESFDDFRQIKKELYRLGFAVAARPLPDGAPIGASPEGTRSAAE